MSLVSRASTDCDSIADSLLQNEADMAHNGTFHADCSCCSLPLEALLPIDCWLVGQNYLGWLCWWMGWGCCCYSQLNSHYSLLNKPLVTAVAAAGHYSCCQSSSPDGRSDPWVCPFLPLDGALVVLLYYSLLTVYCWSCQNSQNWKWQSPDAAAVVVVMYHRLTAAVGHKMSSICLAVYSQKLADCCCWRSAAADYY